MAYPDTTLTPAEDLYPSDRADAGTDFALVSAVQVSETGFRVTWTGRGKPKQRLDLALAGTYYRNIRSFSLVEDKTDSRSMIVEGLYPGLAWIMRAVDQKTGQKADHELVITLTYEREIPEGWSATASGTLFVSEADVPHAGPAKWTIDLANHAPRVRVIRTQANKYLVAQQALIGFGDLAGAGSPKSAWFTYAARIEREITGLKPGTKYQLTLAAGAAAGGVLGEPSAAVYELGVTNTRIAVPTDGGRTRYVSGEQVASQGLSGVPFVFTATRGSVRIFVRTVQPVSWEGSWADLTAKPLDVVKLLSGQLFNAGNAGLGGGQVYEGRPAIMRLTQVDTTQFYNQEIELVNAKVDLNDVVLDGSVADYLDMYAASIPAKWYVRRDGVTALTMDAPDEGAPKAYFADTDGLGHLGYHDPVVAYGMDAMVNDLTVTNNSVQTKILTTDDWAAADKPDVHVTDDVSIKAYGPVAQTVSMALFDDGVNLDQRMQDILAAGATPTWAITEITANAQQSPNEAGANLELFDLIEVQYRGMIQLSRIINIDDDIDPSTWQRKLTLERLDMYPVGPSFEVWGKDYVNPGINTFDDFGASQGAETFGAFTDNPRRT